MVVIHKQSCELEPLKPPTFCRDCGSANTWIRNPIKDVTFENGVVCEEAWRCTCCGHSTLMPINKGG